MTAAKEHLPPGTHTHFPIVTARSLFGASFSHTWRGSATASLHEAIREVAKLLV
jgi:hypothetical protein